MVYLFLLSTEKYVQNNNHNQNYKKWWVIGLLINPHQVHCSNLAIVDQGPTLKPCSVGLGPV